MFTGIIEEVGQVEAVREASGGRRFTFAASFGEALKPDQSVCVNGVCLTVEKTSKASFNASAIEETLRKSNLGNLRTGSRINLERAMRPDGRLDGHIVQGHVDATGTVASNVVEGESRLVSISFERRFAPLVVARGSIAIDGVSLTVARLSANQLTVAIIPHTFSHTNAEEWKPGTLVNLEFDLLGKYVVRSLEAFGIGSDQGSISQSWLEEHGFG
jgi:riboflavin synthase